MTLQIGSCNIQIISFCKLMMTQMSCQMSYFNIFYSILWHWCQSHVSSTAPHSDTVLAWSCSCLYFNQRYSKPVMEPNLMFRISPKSYKIFLLAYNGLCCCLVPCPYCKFVKSAPPKLNVFTSLIFWNLEIQNKFRNI